MRAVVELSFLADDVRGAFDLAGQARVHFDDFVERVGNLAGGAGELDGHAYREVTFLHGDQSAQEQTIEILGRELARPVNTNAGGHGGSFLSGAGCGGCPYEAAGARRAPSVLMGSDATGGPVRTLQSAAKWKLSRVCGGGCVLVPARRQSRHVRARSPSIRAPRD